MKRLRYRAVKHVNPRNFSLSPSHVMFSSRLALAEVFASD